MSESKSVKAQIAYSRPEELTSSIIHALCAVLSVVGLIFLMLKYGGAGGATVAATVLYGISLIATFTLGALRHLFKVGSRARLTVERFDRCEVAVLTAGAFAPVMLAGFARGGATDAIWGYSLFTVISVAVVLAVFFNAMDYYGFKAFSLVVYVVLGFACVMRAELIMELMGRGYFWFLLGGGMVYAVGTLFYAIGKIPFNHAIWHLFIAGGAAMQFTGVYIYLQ